MGAIALCWYWFAVDLFDVVVVEFEVFVMWRTFLRERQLVVEVVPLLLIERKRNFLPLSMCLVRQTGQQATFDFELCSCGRVLIVLQSWTACSDWNQFVGLVCGKYFQPLTKTGIGQTEHIRRYSYEFFYHRILTLHGQFRRKFVAILFYNNHQKNSFPTCDMLFDYSRITFLYGKELYLPSGASVGGGGSAVVTDWKKKGKIVPLSMCPFRETRQTTFSF